MLCFINPRNNIEANLLPLRLEQRHVLNDPAGSSVKGRLNLHIWNIDQVSDVVRSTDKNEQQAFKVLGRGGADHKGKGQDNRAQRQEDGKRISIIVYRVSTTSERIQTRLKGIRNLQTKCSKNDCKDHNVEDPVTNLF